MRQTAFWIGHDDIKSSISLRDSSQEERSCPCPRTKRYLLPLLTFHKHFGFRVLSSLSFTWTKLSSGWLLPLLLCLRPLLILRPTTPSTLTRAPLWSWPLRARWSPPAPPSPSSAKATSRTSASASPRASRRRGTTGSPRSEEIWSWTPVSDALWYEWEFRLRVPECASCSAQLIQSTERRSWHCRRGSSELLMSRCLCVLLAQVSSQTVHMKCAPGPLDNLLQASSLR